ncbi:MAG: PAS domain S-box protein, partial [Leptolinea sp.]
MKISQQKLGEQDAWEAKLDSTLAVLNKLLISSSPSIEDIAVFILGWAKKLTLSPNGFISLVDPLTGNKIVYSLAGKITGEWQIEDGIQKMVIPPGSDGQYPWLRGQSLNSDEAFYINSPASHLAAKGIPTGFIPIERFLSVPAVLGSQAVGQIALCNAEKDYSDRDLKTIQRLSEPLALAVHRHNAETVLNESEKRFRTIFQQAAVGVALVETKTGVFNKINKKFCDFLGYPMAELLGVSFQAITHPDDVQESEYNNNLLESGKMSEYSIDKRYVTKDGRVVWGNLTVSPLWAPGEELVDHFHIAVVQDLTEKMIIEETHSFLLQHE